MNIQVLIDKIVAEANITPEQAQQSIQTIAKYLKEEYPMLSGAIKKIFETQK
ncbi:MAG: hypothetical protein ORN58_07285 [Sediminibacterium sp.]|nr:hypothetical protein [Sediminibacterium sp.]